MQEYSMPEITISFAQQSRCVRREIALRARVYPRLVAQGKMRQDEAERELAAMRAVHETIARAAGAATALREAGEAGRGSDDNLFL